MKNIFEGKTALVCGSTQGIGLATARLLSERGCRIILLARNEEKLKQAQKEEDEALNIINKRYFSLFFFTILYVTFLFLYLTFHFSPLSYHNFSNPLLSYYKLSCYS